MNELQVFNYGDTPIRTVEREDGIWWVLKAASGFSFPTALITGATVSRSLPPEHRKNHLCRMIR